MSIAVPQSRPPPNPVIGRAFAAFHYRDFRVLWFGAFTSTVGNWMQQVAQSWLVFELTNSSFYLGLDYFFGQLPILLLTLIGGVVADRHDRRYVLLGSQLVQMATAFALAALIVLESRPRRVHPRCSRSSPGSARPSAVPPTRR